MQIDNICTKLARANGILPKLRHFIPRKHVHQYISLCFTLMSFMVVWFGPTQLSEIYIESPNYKNGAFGLLLTQNSNTGPLFSELKLVKVKDIFSLTKLLFLYEFINDYVPEELKTIFIIKIPTHSYETHSSMVFHIPKAKT